MSTIVLGCDSNGVNDSGCQNTIKEALEKAGHTVEKLPIAPGPFADYSYSSKASGKIGVYIMADSLVSVADLALGNTSFKYAYFIIRGDLGLPRMSKMEHFQNNPIGRDADCTSICDKLAGKTYPQMNEIIKDKAHIVFGTTPEEMANNLIKAMGGETDTENSSETSSFTSIKEALKKAVSGWDGDVEIILINDTVYVNKIKSPITARLEIDEYYNAIYDTITVRDINPLTINHLTLSYNEYELLLKDDNLIKRFGRHFKKIDADKTIKSLEEAESFLQREWNKIRRDDGRQVEVKVKGGPGWKNGEWVKVFLPSYFIDDYMYIIKASHEEDGTGNWLTNLTLVDYPPSFGEFEEEAETEVETETETNTDEADTTEEVP